jgi:hypothetical protein
MISRYSSATGGCIGGHLALLTPRVRPPVPPSLALQRTCAAGEIPKDGDYVVHRGTANGVRDCSSRDVLLALLCPLR